MQISKTFLALLTAFPAKLCYQIMYMFFSVLVEHYKCHHWMLKMTNYYNNNYYYHYYYYYTRSIGLFLQDNLVSQYQKSKTSLDLNEARDDGVWRCSGISWTICKQSAPHSRQTTKPTPHHSKNDLISKNVILKSICKTYHSLRKSM